MFDVWIGDFLAVIAAPAYLISAVVRLRPRLLAGEGAQLVGLGVLQSEYEKRYPIRLFLLRILPPVLCLYFGLRLLFWPTGIVADGPSRSTLSISGLAMYLASVIALSILRIRHERAFVKDHPAFSDSFLPIRPRVLSLAPWIISLCALVAGTAVEGDSRFVLLFLGAFGLILGGMLRSRQVTHSRYELPWDEDLGRRIAQVVEQFGLKPKKLILLPSLIANAGAMPDGSVVVTSALRTLATPDEVAAVVAHELSHVRDQEGKMWERLRIIAATPMGILVGVSVVGWIRTPFEYLLPPFVVFSAMTISTVTTLWFCSRTQPREFKCDADAARLGLGLEMASCLDKTTRFMGMPPRWIGLDRYLVTHPSLEDRVARLRSREVEGSGGGEDRVSGAG